MNLDRYPAQEPLSALGATYQQRVFALGEGLAGTDCAYGPDAYQSLSIFRPAQPSGDVLVFSRDFPHLIVQAQQMSAALRAARVPVQTEVLEGCDHFEASLACGDAQGPWLAKAVAWMRTVDA